MGVLFVLSSPLQPSLNTPKNNDKKEKGEEKREKEGREEGEGIHV